LLKQARLIQTLADELQNLSAGGKRLLLLGSARNTLESWSL
jgi:hypothetical protein